MAEEKKQETRTEAKAQTAKQQFSKEQIVASVRYRGQQDLVDTLLEDGKQYTFETVDKLIERYRKGRVK